MKIASSFVASVLLMGAASQVFAAVPAEVIEIKSIQYNGSGCPMSTVAENVSSDKQAFTLSFSDYVAEAGPNLPPSSGRKNCQLTMVLNVPAGWQFSIASFYYRGFMELDTAMKAQQTASYYFQGQGATGKFSSNKTGQYSGDYVYNDNIGLSSAIWSACGVERALNVNTSIRVYNTNSSKYPNSSGLITTDSVDGQIKQIWGITWRQC
jgi:hypothetical protein